MSTVNRTQFQRAMRKGGINVNDMSPKLRASLAKAGVSEADVKKIGGRDGRISTAAEVNKLFKLVDGFDKNGSAYSFKSKDAGGVLTTSGKLYEGLKAEAQKNVQKARNQGVIHLGMRPASTREAAALKAANPKRNGGVHEIQGWKSDGVVSHGGKSHDLTKKVGLDSFEKSLTKGKDKMPKAQAKKFVAFLKTQNRAARDEMAKLGLALHRTGKGDLPMNRIVLSGHGSPSGNISGDGAGSFSLKDVEKLGKVFPKGAGKIEHAAVSACFCAGEANFEALRKAFPNLKSAMAYNGFSPKAETRAPKHLARWESITDGDDPSQVDPPYKGTATWNVADGTQGLPSKTLTETEEAAKDMEHAYTAYTTGGKDPKLATRDSALNEYYVRLADLERHPDISPERKKEVVARRKAVLKLRHPELDL